MSNAIKEYKQFIDDIVSLSNSVLSQWILEKRFPKIAEYQKENKILDSLNMEQKELVAKQILEAKKSGIHDRHFYLYEQQLNDSFKIFRNSLELPIEPFDTPLNFDYIARLEKDIWPDE